MAKWISNTAMEEVDCPKCGQKAGNWCKTPSGKTLTGTDIHKVRISIYQKSISKEEFDKRHTIKAYTFDEIIKRVLKP